MVFLTLWGSNFDVQTNIEVDSAPDALTPQKGYSKSTSAAIETMDLTMDFS